MSGLFASSMGLFGKRSGPTSEGRSSSQLNSRGGRRKSQSDTNTKSPGPMSILPPVPFPSGSWVSKDENRLKLGRRIRKRGETERKEAQEQPAANISGTNVNVPNVSERTKGFVPALRKAQGRVSRLWNRKAQTNDFTGTNTVASSPLASDDECCRSNISNEGAAPKAHLQQSQTINSGETTLSKHSSMRKRLMRPLHDLRKRSLAPPYSELDRAQESVKVELVTCDEDSLSDDIPPESIPAIEVAPQFIPQASTESPSTTADVDESFSIMDAESTACVQPSVTESSFVAIDQEMQVWEAPKPKMKKDRKPKHGDDSVLIGMIITFDPTTELLNMGNEPQCIKRTMLRVLQKNEEYQGCLLGKRTDEEESSTEETPSVSDILGFHLDSFALPKLDTSIEEVECPFPSESLEMDVGDEVEIVFSSGSRGPIQVFNPAEDSFETDNQEEEIEIVFDYVGQIHSPDEFDSSDDSSMSGKFMDCRSNTSSDSALPLEWMLPEASRPQVRTKEFLDKSFEVDEPPEYEWYLPDHFDVQLPNEHTPMVLFGDGASQKTKITVTPSTMCETCSFDYSEGSAHGEVLSVGSLPSEAVQSLLDFCHSDASTLEKRLSRETLLQYPLSAA